jgi:hypothetical protein
MNAIDSHKDELERLLVKLSRDAAVSGMAFVALLDAYIRDLDRNCSGSAPAFIQRRRKSSGNQHGLRTARFIARNIQLQKVAPYFPKFSTRSSQTCFVHSVAYDMPRRQVRRCR